MSARRILIALVAVLGFVAAACGSDGGPAVSSPSTTASAGSGADDGVDDHGDSGAQDDGDDHGSFAFGEPADPDDADRVVDIEMNDEFRFVPDDITVAHDETITFRLHNAGAIAHDFTIGDAATQDRHEAEMAQMSPDDMASHGAGNAITVQPGQTEELTWHFTGAHDLLFGCHIPGHYDAGMKGTFTEAD